jgi:hypothetical protein
MVQCVLFVFLLFQLVFVLLLLVFVLGIVFVFAGMTADLPVKRPIRAASVLLNLGDFVTTDHISPAGT